jgi:hypothetical protein
MALLGFSLQVQVFPIKGKIFFLGMFVQLIRDDFIKFFRFGGNGFEFDGIFVQNRLRLKKSFPSRPAGGTGARCSP